MIKTIFFHPLTWDNDMYIVYVVWALVIAAVLWLVRYVHKSIRKPQMNYQGVRYYLCRDVFLGLTGFEYLIAFVVLLAIYLGCWAYVVRPSTSANWSDWQTYLVILPQVACVVTAIIVFAVRYTKFRKPYIK